MFVYQCGYNEDLIFPFYKRATSIGICNFIGRCVTIMVPIVAELDKPIPALMILGINVLGFLACFLLPSRDEVLANKKLI